MAREDHQDLSEALPMSAWRMPLRAIRSTLWIAGAFLFLSAVFVLGNPTWRIHAFRLFLRAWQGFLATEGSSTVGMLSNIASPLLAIGITIALVRRHRGQEAMKRHWREEAGIAARVVILVTLFVYGPVLLWTGVETLYVDHRDLVASVGNLVRSAKLNERTISKLERENNNLEQHPTIVKEKLEEPKKLIVFETGFTPSDRSAPEGMALLLTTNATIPAPFQVVINCESPIVGYGVSFLRTVRGNFTTQTSEHPNSDGGITLDVGMPSFTVGTAIQINVTSRGRLGFCHAEVKPV